MAAGLSTFSGHVARLTSILRTLRPPPAAHSTASATSGAEPSSSGGSSGGDTAQKSRGGGGTEAAGDHEEPTEGASIVLLDEPGGGTDPKEGAALATALLEALADRASLTVVTSHYEEAKELALRGDSRRDVLTLSLLPHL